ncbi:MAG: histidine--tRNA ligase [Endomicrobium sp.]|jgi:histidyl-tRNA synthetase|nr:histidine--tRNA ligase [Endomicrobium sp.]
MRAKAPRGTHDIFGTCAARMNLLEQKARDIFMRSGFEEIRTPIFEDASLFIRSVGEMTDIVEKEMYVFEDKKRRKLVLRPEGTAPIVRAFIEHRMDILRSIGKFFYAGEMFRYERPQAGRYRQFHQIGAEFFGVSSPVADVEIILLVCDLLRSVGISEVKVRLNSLGCQKCRPVFKEELVKYLASEEGLCEDCLKRLKNNPLRVLDCKIDSHKFNYAPKMSCYLCNECRGDFDLLRSLLDVLKCDYNVDNKLVRGLDYYTKTVFEIYSSNSAIIASVGRDCKVKTDTEDDIITHVSKYAHFNCFSCLDVNHSVVLAAGGRYDNLVEELGGESTPAVGFALGSERVLIAAGSNSTLFNKIREIVVKVLFEMQKNSIPLNEKEISDLFKEVSVVALNSMLINKKGIDDLFKMVLDDVQNSQPDKLAGCSGKFLDENFDKLKEVLATVQNPAIFNSLQEEKICVAIADRELIREAFLFAVKIRRDGLKNNKNVSVFYPIYDKTLTWQLKFADKIGAYKTIIFSKTEFEKGKVLVKNMKEKIQTQVSIDEL